jgi:hypothetical protein
MPSTPAADLRVAEAAGAIQRARRLAPEARAGSVALMSTPIAVPAGIGEAGGGDRARDVCAATARARPSTGT